MEKALEVKDHLGYAIEVKDAVKSYGSQEVLKQLNMAVPYGSIYGLLGSSGCGKTTLLRCILGRLNLSGGDIVVLGQAPGTRGHKVPGRDVGYMPQEMALYGDFTTHETMLYFGMLHGMSSKRVKQRRKFLLELLELQTKSKLIKKLSGGQKRRFSFAVAMLQEPPLLILDEPTVGVDPLLRSKIWQHMLDIVSTGNTTIIITTHYIEEAKQAHLVGLMRDGKLLAESSPDSLIRSHHMTTLEEVFLLLCQRQEVQKSNPADAHSTNGKKGLTDLAVYHNEPDENTPLVDSLTTSFSEDNEVISSESCFDSVKKKAKGMIESVRTSCRCHYNPSSCFPGPRNVLALCWKNVVRIYRNPGLVLFQFLLPTLQIALFCLAVGNKLTGIKAAYVNLDIGLDGAPFSVPPDFHLYNICSNTAWDGGFLSVDNLGDLYITKLRNDPTFDLVEVNSTKEAKALVKKGDAWAAFVIYETFTWDLVVRMCSITPEQCKSFGSLIPVSDASTIYNSTIHILADITNAQITVSILNQTLDAYQLFLEEIIQSCSNVLHINQSLFSPPIEIEQPPVYGEMGLSFIDYMGPGVITSITFGISIGLSAVALIVERNEGLIDRTWVAGVNVVEIIIAQVITHFFILLVQISLMLVVVLCGFQIYNRYTYNVWLIGVLAMFQGLTGMSFGLFLSAICSTENAALQASVAAFYPAILLSGVMWPFEGMPEWLRYISAVLPATYPAEAMRAIMGRGWGLAYFQVWRGFLVSGVWFVFFLFNAGLALWLRK